MTPKVKVYDSQLTIELSNVLQEAGAQSASASFTITEWLIDGKECVIRCGGSPRGCCGKPSGR